MLGARVNDFHTREASEGDGLLDNGERAGDEGLAGYDRGQNGHHKHRPIHLLRDGSIEGIRRHVIVIAEIRGLPEVGQYNRRVDHTARTNLYRPH